MQTPVARVVLRRSARCTDAPGATPGLEALALEEALSKKPLSKKPLSKKNMARPRTMVLGLGSNLGDRATLIAKATERLGAAPSVHVVRVGGLYESPPAGGPAQGDYLNTAVRIETALSPREVLDLALSIERDLGRVRPDPVRWGPRTIDIDLLWIEGEPIDEEGLTVPHPRLAERPFAVQPLVDVAPEATDPVTGKRYADAEAARAPLKRAV
ncbi:MAG: 2-amino-4-hydroxy-6-hydroxymethyldihydropteridine diphosphokinase [Polyangiaceae bacterium]